MFAVDIHINIIDIKNIDCVFSINCCIQKRKKAFIIITFFNVRCVILCIVYI